MYDTGRERPTANVMGCSPFIISFYFFHGLTAPSPHEDGHVNARNMLRIVM